MKAVRQKKVDWWVGGAFLIGLGGVAMDAQATFTGLLIVLLGCLAMIVGWRLPTAPELVRQRLDQLRETTALLGRKLPAGILLVDQESRILFANEHALSLLEGKAAEVLDSPLDRWLGPASAENRGEATPLPARRFRKADGREFLVHMSEAAVEVPGDPPLPALRILIMNDVSGWLDLHRRYQQTERLRTAATMASQFAHEVRNPVAAISGSAQVLGRLQRQVADSHAPHTISESDRALLYQCIVSESDRLDGIISKFLSVNEFPEERMDEILRDIPEGEDPLRPFSLTAHHPKPEPSHAT